MAEIALLGYGTVGSGVVEVLETNQLTIDKKAFQPINIKYILDRKDFPDDSLGKKIVHDFDCILNDDAIKIVVEMLGGLEPAYSYVKQSLLKGKSVITSNKELVAKYGAELSAIAKRNNINFLFEASVAGGIPIIRLLNRSFTADKITKIVGILNGTTNYILSKMATESRNFEDVLKQAQEKGYAERDPHEDVSGKDACRKLSILLSLSTGYQIDFQEIHTEGIEKITIEDILYAKELGGVMKLLAYAKIVNDKVEAVVSPFIINNSHPLSKVDDVFNGVFVKGNVLGETMFYGKGAGKLPTASAVVSDIVDCLKHLERNIPCYWSEEKYKTLPVDEMNISKLVRISFEQKKNAISSIKNVFGEVEILEIDGLLNEFGFITAFEKEKNIKEKISILEKAPEIKEIKNIIRIEGNKK